MMKMKTTMMMMMMMVSVSTSPLPPSLSQHRRDDHDAEVLHLLENRENVTRFDYHQNISESEGMASVGVATRMQTETSNSSDAGVPTVFQISDSDPHVIRKPLSGCFLSTCLTANLGSSLQVGDETAGSAASSAFGNGRK